MDIKRMRTSSITATTNQNYTPIYEVKTTVSSPVKFFNAISTFASRPELLLPNLRSTDIEWSSVPPALRKGYNNQSFSCLFDVLYSSIYNEGKGVLSDVSIGEFSGTLLEKAIQILLEPQNNIHQVSFKRKIHVKPQKDAALGSSFMANETWDFENYSVEVNYEGICSVLDFTAKFYPSQNLSSIRLYQRETHFKQDENLLDVYKATIIPKLLDWLSDNYNSHPPKLTRLRPRPITYIRNEIYWLFTDLLKAGPAEKIKQIWQESTDPVKFIHEDVGIAAYICSFMYDVSEQFRIDSKKEEMDILDIGCGNGLLCYFLSQIASAYSRKVNITGYDIRKRKIWDDILQKPVLHHEMKSNIQHSDFAMSLNPVGLCHPDSIVNLELKERAFVPHLMDDLIEQYYCTNEQRVAKSLWIIGNHSDELTPWIPVIARRLNATGFFIIPCCPYDFFAKYQRKGSLPGSSIYQNYIEYICTVGDDFGYRPALDKLRIPSTKNICLLGVNCFQNVEPKILSDRVENILTKLREGDEGNSILKFVPRSVESAKSSPKVDKNIADKIIEKIFSLLIKDWPVVSDKWYGGRTDLTFLEITSNLEEEERKMLKGKGNGLQTLIKSNKHLFTINGKCVCLRIPNENDLQNVQKTSRDKIKSRNCYFYVNHPQGCPLPSELCTYKHEKG